MCPFLLLRKASSGLHFSSFSLGIQIIDEHYYVYCYLDQTFSNAFDYYFYLYFFTFFFFFLWKEGFSMPAIRRESFTNIGFKVLLRPIQSRVF